MANNFDGLTDIINETINQIVQTQTLDIGNFYSQIENEFIRLGFRDDQQSGVESILLIRLDNMGDFILTTPAIREVRQNYPSAYITLLVSNRAYPMAKFCPYVNEVLMFDVEFDQLDVSETLKRIYEFAWTNLLPKRYSLAFSFRYFDSYFVLPLFMTYLSGARQRVGYDFEATSVYTRSPFNSAMNDIMNLMLTNPNPGNKEIINDCARSLYLIKSFGLKIHNAEHELWYTSDDLYQAKKLMNGFAPDRIKILAGIGASSDVKCYPVEKYLIAFKQLIDKGAAIILAGGPTDEHNAKFLQENLPTEYVKNLMEFKTKWRVMAAVMTQADMYIGNDTGTVHIAAAAKLPVISLTRVAEDCPSPNESDIYSPWQTNSIILKPKHQIGECKDANDWTGCIEGKSHCIAQIEPDEIVAAYHKMLFNSLKSLKQVQTPDVIQSMKRTEQLLSIDN